MSFNATALVNSPSAHTPVKYDQIHDETEIKAETSETTTSDKNFVQATFRSKFSTWQSGLAFCIAIDVLVLLLTTVVTLVSALAFPRDGAFSTLVDGSCSKSRSWNIWLRLLANGVCTTLLATTGYATQCLISPTRADLDKAHLRGDYMHIGTLSLRNFSHVRLRRRILYVLALVSSLPLHLLANSVVFNTIGTDSYLLTTAYQNFVDQSAAGTFNATDTGEMDRIFSFNSARQWASAGEDVGNPKEDIALNFSLTISRLRTLLPHMTRLENKDCIEHYSRQVITGRRHVIAVGETVPPGNKGRESRRYVSSLYYQYIDVCPDCQTYLNWTDPTIWTCAFLTDKNNPTRSCDVPAAAAHAAQFSINGMPIAYCLSEQVEEKCQLQVNIEILGAVIVCALMKICVLSLATRAIPDTILSTIGDAISSFLHQPDDVTDRCCLLSYRDVQRMKRTGKPSPDHRKSTMQRVVACESPGWIPGNPFPMHWSSLRLQSPYNETLPMSSWLGTIFALFSVAVLATAGLVMAVVKIRNHSGLQGTTSNSLHGLPSSIPGLWRLGFGAVNANFLMQLNNSSSPARGQVVWHILIINSPQVVMTVCYYFYYNLWANMLLGREWASYGIRRQGLRVSRPRSIHQRSSYFLTIPFAFAAPLHFGSIILHWLLSQSLFLARINVYSGEPFAHFPVSTINTVGYSPIALFIFILVCIVLLIAVYSVGCCCRFKSAIPVVGACSLAISAACHPATWEQGCDMALQEVMWGVVPHPVDRYICMIEAVEGSETEIRHCSFSAGEVSSPETLPMRKMKRLTGKRCVETVAAFE